MSWHAGLELGFCAEGGATWLARRAHHGPFLVQRPFFPEGREVCHVYLLHPPGGLVGGDELRLDLRVDPGAHTLVTTPAAGKAYRTLGPAARQRNELSVAAGGGLEWLPQEMILYDGCRAELDTRVELAGDAKFVGAETLVFGLPARGEPFARASCRQSFELRRDGAPLFIERGRFEGGAAGQAASWGLAGATALTLVVMAPAPGEPVVAALRSLATACGESQRAGVTVLGDEEVLVVRHLGARAEEARAFVQATWRLVRRQLFGRPAVAPRIWAT
ncbi:MAG TPA: urease accessory protein UreD [Polyangia bacterium]|nr:urease accessory protein UreD [Polyangia bacterium]